MWAFPRLGDPDRSVEGEEPDLSVNIGGVRARLPRLELRRFPHTRLAELSRASDPRDRELCDDYEPSSGEFYFDRDPECFRCILELYSSGRVHMRPGLCPRGFSGELEYWGVDPAHLDECCRGWLSEVEAELEEIGETARSLLQQGEEPEAQATPPRRCQARLRRLLERPDSSWVARGLALASFALVLLSSAVMCAGTVPEVQVRDEAGELAEPPALERVETACVAWFTLEYLLRLAASTRRLRFLLSFMNLVDLLAVLPFYLLLLLRHMGAALLQLADVQRAVQALRVMRLARVFKLARHSAGLQTLSVALRSSGAELGLLLLYMGVGVFLLAALGYTLEQSHPDTLFTSLPQAFWWAVITMTTVGYGDVYPLTALGRCNAALSFLCGVIAIALPVHPIINTFVEVYSRQRALLSAARHHIQLHTRHAQDALSDHAHTHTPDTEGHAHTPQ